MRGWSRILTAFTPSARPVCEAYIKSQTAEGWKCLSGRHDDGGYSGGSMERPGLRALMADINLGKIDIVVVYKVNQMTQAETLHVADVSRVMPLAFLSPDIVTAILNGTQPIDLSTEKLKRLRPLPHLWSEQKYALAFE